MPSSFSSAEPRAVETRIFEEHSAVVAEWWRQQTGGRTLLCFDAHLDLQFISPGRLEALRCCETPDAVAELAKPHHLTPDAGYSYSIEDFLIAARACGLIGSVIWVVPPHVNTRAAEGVFAQLQQMEGVCYDDLDTLRVEGDGRIRIGLLGLDLTICNLAHLSPSTVPRDCLVDIDIDYFVATPGDRVWMNPREVFTLLTSLCDFERLTIARSVQSGFTPLRHRFLADYLGALCERREEEAAHFERLLMLDDLAHRDPAAALRGCHEALGRVPDSAAGWYLASLLDPNAANSRDAAKRVAGIAPAYAPDVLRRACGFLGRPLPLDGEIVRSLEAELAEATLDAKPRALAHAAIGLLHARGQQWREAADHYQRCAPVLGGHPELALEIGQALSGAGQHADARPFLETALRDDKTRCVARAMLGHAADAQGDTSAALSLLTTAHASAPAWDDLLPMLADVQRRLGDDGAARMTLEKYWRQQARRDEIAARLGAAR